MNNELETYLLSKSSITIGSCQIAKTFVKKSTSPLKQRSTSHKSGEIFRCENGQFSFLCSLCGAVCETCPGIVDHINSHFEKQKSLGAVDMPESLQLAQPEFISTGETIKYETDVTQTSSITSNGISRKFPNVTLESKFSNGSNWSKNSCNTETMEESNPPERVVRIIKRKRSAINDTAGDKLNSAVTTKIVEGGSDVKYSANEEPGPTTKIVRIIKRKRREIADTVSEQTKSLPLLTKIEVPSEIITIPDDEPDSAPTTRIVRIIKRKRSKIGQVAGDGLAPNPRIVEEKCNEIKQSANAKSDSVQIPDDDKSSSAPTNKIIKIVKLKRIHFRPGAKACTKDKNQSHKNVQQISVDLTKEETTTELSPAADDTVTMPNENVPNEEQKNNDNIKPQSVLPPYKKKRSCCYQCEMEPRIYERSDPRRHICLFCPTWFPNHVDFEHHVWTEHGKNPNYVLSKDFYCYICEKRFDFRQNLWRHMIVHKETADFLCASCGSSFKTIGRLNDHMKSHKDQTFVCDECGKEFKQFVRLRNHLWCHNTKLSFVCRVCSKGFKMKRYLDLHMAVHREAKINCRYCDATFRFKWVRRVHERNRHNVIEN